MERRVLAHLLVFKIEIDRRPSDFDHLLDVGGLPMARRVYQELLEGHLVFALVHSLLLSKNRVLVHHRVDLLLSDLIVHLLFILIFLPQMWI